MILSGRAALHGAVDRQQAGALIDLPEQAVPGQIHRFGAQCIQFIYKMDALFLSPLSPLLHALPEIPLRALGAQMSQITAGKAVHRAGEHTEQRHILPGIVHDFKECDRHGHLSLCEKISGAVTAPRDAVSIQRPGQVPHNRTGRAVQNGDILRLNHAEGVPVGDGEAAVQQSAHPAGHELRFRRIPAHLCLPLFPLQSGHIHYVELHPVIRVLRIRQPGIEPLVIGIVQLAERGGHNIFKNKVYTLQHRGPGAEIIGQDDLAGFAVLCILILLEPQVLAQEDGGVRQPETVDGLLDVAHLKEACPAAADGAKDGVLHLVGVLIFIHHDLRVALLPPLSQLVGSALLIGEQLQSQMLQIGKVHQISAALLPAVHLVKIRRQLQKLLHHRAHPLHIRQQIRAGIRKGVRQLGKALLALVPDGFYLLL